MAEERTPQTEAQAAATRLRQSLRGDVVAGSCVIIAIGLLFVVPLRSLPGALSVVALLMTLVVAYYSLRIRFDAGIFEQWSTRPDIDAAVQEFDAALARRFPGRSLPAVRPLADRAAGAFALARRHRGWCGLQATAILVAAAASVARGF
ncbi:hypothetical protein [Arenimonas sp.]|uniref:hypothetical protein n=1 Tax=Arenimonas sp. TaxID=1872635 RepID=UPI0039E35D7C